MIETWGFRVDIKDVKGIGLMMITTMRRRTTRWRTTTRTTTMTRVSQLWYLIETWGFREDIKDVKGIGLMMMTMINPIKSINPIK